MPYLWATTLLLRFLFGLFAAVAVTLLNLADELVIVAVDEFNVVVRHFAPRLLHATLELIPLTFKDVGIHGIFPFLSVFDCADRRRKCRNIHFTGTTQNSLQPLTGN